MSKSSTDFKEDAVTMAEAAVNGSIARFEGAMDHLAKKIDTTMDAVQRVSHAIEVPKEKFNEIKETVTDIVKPLAPFYGMATVGISRMLGGVKRNPRPLLFAAGALVAGWMLYRALTSKENPPYLEQGQELH